MEGRLNTATINAGISLTEFRLRTQLVKPLFRRDHEHVNLRMRLKLMSISFHHLQTIVANGGDEFEHVYGRGQR